MAKAHKLDCESVSDTCRFIIQSENEEEAVELARKHMQEVHGQEYSDDELRNDHLQVV
jgi:predicted small metal-binding protein